MKKPRTVPGLVMVARQTQCARDDRNLGHKPWYVQNHTQAAPLLTAVRICPAATASASIIRCSSHWYTGRQNLA